MSDALVYDFALNQIFPGTVKRQLELIAVFGSAQKAFLASRDELENQTTLKPEQIDVVLACRNFEFYQKQLQAILASGIQVLSYQNPKYPKRLLEISSYPTLLYCRGDLTSFENTTFLAVVGSRDMTNYGREVIEHIIKPICEAGVVIVSGLAFGVDACAHEVCVNTKTKTIAVQANGVERSYPRGNQQLYERIVQNGCVISEFATQVKGLNDRVLFPRRNRLISGLADGVLIVEAKEKSGALITAQFALEQNRNVYAVPGDIFKQMSKGCLNLIRDGAKPVTCAQDILEDFDLATPSEKILTNKKEKSPKIIRSQTDSFETPLQAQIFACCAEDAKSIDDLLDSVIDSASAVSAALTKMEIMGRVKDVGGRRFVAVE